MTCILNQFVHSSVAGTLLISNAMIAFMKIFLWQRVPQVTTCLSFLILLKSKVNISMLLKKTFFDWKEMTENINDGSETVSALIDDLLNMLITALNNTCFWDSKYNSWGKCYHCTREKNFAKSKLFRIFFLRLNLSIMFSELFL